MTDEYLAFVIAYDYSDVLNYLDLPCDMAFDLCMKVVQKARREINGEVYYDTFTDYLCELFEGRFNEVAERLVSLGILNPGWREISLMGEMIY